MKWRTWFYKENVKTLSKLHSFSGGCLDSSSFSTNVVFKAPCFKSLCFKSSCLGLWEGMSAFLPMPCQPWVSEYFQNILGTMMFSFLIKLGRNKDAPELLFPTMKVYIVNLSGSKQGLGNTYKDQVCCIMSHKHRWDLSSRSHTAAGPGVGSLFWSGHSPLLHMSLSRSFSPFSSSQFWGSHPLTLSKLSTTVCYVIR